MALFTGINQRIADRLLTEGRINRDAHQRAVEYATRKKQRIEDAIVELDLLSEADLLKFIATVHRTRFVSTERLAKAAIDQRLLARVPVKMADLHGVFPVLFDDKNAALSIVTADPDNDLALHELKLAAGVREVRPLVARPAAVRAAIALHYHKDRRAFGNLLPLFGADRGSAGSLPDFTPDEDPFGRSATARRADTHSGSKATQPTPPPVRKPPSSTPPQAPVQAAPPSPMQPQVQVIAAPASSAPVVIVPPIPQVKTPSLPPPSVRTPHTASAEFVETLNVLVSLIENSRPDLRGHSSMVARITRKTCERIGLNATQVSAFTAAAYLHDLGKMGAYHLTALNVAEYEGHRLAAIKSVELPIHLMESVNLLPDTIAAIGSMYERFDGQGFPNGRSGKEIPLGGRILAVADTYADLTQNPRNPYRKILRPFEACDVLAQYKGSVFDPNIVDLFRQSMTGEDMRAKLLSDRHEALIIDADPEETTVLELRLIEHGFEVRIARTAAQAQKLLEGGEIDLVVSEVDLEKPDAGLTLRKEAMDQGFGRDVAWVFLTSKTDRKTAQRAFDLGVDDFVPKPVPTDIFAARMRQLLERRAASSGAARGVSGSLAEMGLPDIVQILWHGRKTCALRIQGPSGNGEIHFVDGQIWNARWGQKNGEDAFYKIIAMQEGDFRVDPNFTATERTIQASPEGLLLEGMRRLDEGVSDGPN